MRKSVPILGDLRAWAEKQKETVLPSSAIGEAIDYLLNHFVALSRYVEDGRLQIDNNDVEREVRPLTLGRKNYLFFGGERGGQFAATFYTLIANCRVEKIDAFEYLRDVLSRVPTSSAAAIAALTPQRWKDERDAARAPAVAIA